MFNPKAREEAGGGDHMVQVRFRGDATCKPATRIGNRTMPAVLTCRLFLVPQAIQEGLEINEMSALYFVVFASLVLLVIFFTMQHWIFVLIKCIFCFAAVQGLQVSWSMPHH